MNLLIWLAKTILCHKLKIKIFLQMGFTIEKCKKYEFTFFIIFIKESKEIQKYCLYIILGHFCQTLSQE